MTDVQFNNNYDVFHSFLVEKADYDGYFELPKTRTSSQLPDRVITFSKAMARTWNDFDCWVMFYEHDVNFERLWHNPKTGEKWNSDLNHGDPIGPHWDYIDSNGNKYRVFPDGRLEKK